ncbi:hypothetical protein ACFL5Z_10275 [Planctomycetota bacterium]
MKRQTSKHFYRHSESGRIVVMEKRLDGVILGSCSAPEPLRDLDSYECKPDNNLWVMENSDRLILM